MKLALSQYCYATDCLTIPSGLKIHYVLISPIKSCIIVVISGQIAAAAAVVP